MTEKSRIENRDLIRAVIGFTLYLLFVPALLFIAAGTMKWPMAWAYTVLLLASTIGSRLIVWKRSPDTLRERAKFTSAEGTKPWDRVLVAIVGIFGPMAMMLVAGLDQRLGWSAVVPKIAQYLGILVIAAGCALAVWAMVINPFFSAVMRIQEDRGQVVVTSGPYRMMRHPSYAGALFAYLAFPVMLDALWALVPALVLVVALIIRTGLEDRMLRRELDGYQRYAEETRYRLVPGVW